MTREELEQTLQQEISEYDGEDLEGRILAVEAGNPETAAQARWLWRYGGVQVNQLQPRLILR